MAPQAEWTLFLNHSESSKWPILRWVLVERQLENWHLRVNRVKSCCEIIFFSLVVSNISTFTITGFLRAAFVFKKSLSVSFTVLITFYLLIEKGTSFNLKTQKVFSVILLLFLVSLVRPRVGRSAILFFSYTLIRKFYNEQMKLPIPFSVIKTFLCSFSMPTPF